MAPWRLSGAWAICRSAGTGLLAHLEGAMKVGLLGTGFGLAHARIYYTHPRSARWSSPAAPRQAVSLRQRVRIRHHRPVQHLRRPHYRPSRRVPAHPTAPRAHHPGGAIWGSSALSVGGLTWGSATVGRSTPMVRAVDCRAKGAAERYAVDHSPASVAGRRTRSERVRGVVGPRGAVSSGGRWGGWCGVVLQVVGVREWCAGPFTCRRRAGQSRSHTS